MKRITIALVLATFVPACSFLFARVPDHTNAAGKLNCPIASPVLDTIFAVSDGVALAQLAANANQPAASTYVWPVVADAVLWTASAIYGWSKRSECEQLNHRAPAELARSTPSSLPPSFAPAPVIDARSPEVARLAATAAARARAGDCATALTVAEHVKELDVAYYGSVLALDPAIAACSSAPR